MPSAYIGCGIGNFKGNIRYKMIPTLRSKVLFDESLNSRDVLKYFNILEEEDPSLKVIWNEKPTGNADYYYGYYSNSGFKGICT